MKLYIGENIKRLRRERDMTQEELAEQLGVSFQSVSRWENGACYPDIELIPELSAFFGVSADSLMGLDTTREEAAVQKILDDFQTAVSGGNVNECIQIARKGLKEHPGSYAIMNKLMYALFLSGDDTAGIPDWQENAGKYDQEITRLGERIMKYCPDQDIRFEAAVRLAFNHCEMGRKQQGRAIYESLPGLEQSREGYIWESLEDDERAVNARDMIYKSYDFMTAGFWQLLALDNVPDIEKEDIIRAAGVISRLIEGEAEQPRNGQWLVRCARVYAGQKKYAEAFSCLHAAAEQAIEFEKRPERGEYGSALIGKREWKRADYEKADSRTVPQIMAEYWLGHAAFDSMRDTEEFKAIINRLKGA